MINLDLGSYYLALTHSEMRKIYFPKIITTPEIHWLHHKNANLAYGDIFTFYDRPAQKWKQFLTDVKVSRLKISR